MVSFDQLGGATVSLGDRSLHLRSQMFVRQLRRPICRAIKTSRGTVKDHPAGRGGCSPS